MTSIPANMSSTPTLQIMISEQWQCSCRHWQREWSSGVDSFARRYDLSLPKLMHGCAVARLHLLQKCNLSVQKDSFGMVGDSVSHSMRLRPARHIGQRRHQRPGSRHQRRPPPWPDSVSSKLHTHQKSPESRSRSLDPVPAIWFMCRHRSCNHELPRICDTAPGLCCYPFGACLDPVMP